MISDDDSDDTILIDLPEFGGLKDWLDCLAELQTLPPSDEIAAAILRCQEEIAEIKGLPPSAFGERQGYQDGSMVFDKK